MPYRPTRKYAAAVALAGVGVYAIALICLLLAPNTKTRATAGTAVALPALPQHANLQASNEPLVGFALNLHYTSQFYRYLAAVDEIADLGCNSIIVITPVWQENGESNKIQIINEPGRGPSTEQISQLLDHAKSRGLKTTLMPIVLMTDPGEKQWRGRISPTSWHEWWVSYREVINRFAQIAQQSNVDVFCVGSELLTTESQASRWRSLIYDVRHRFTGSITYSTNWDHYEKTRFWADVDIIGVNGYWDITSKGDIATENAQGLRENWVTIRNNVYEFAKSHDRPLLFTEIGYPSLPWALSSPWNYVADSSVPAAPQVQAAGYLAFVQAMSPVLEAKLDIALPSRFKGSREADDSPGSQSVADNQTTTDQLDADDNANPDQATAPTLKLDSAKSEAVVGHASTRGRAEWFTGVYFYSWDPYNRGNGHDRGYGVRGKPAQNIVGDWLAEMHKQLADN